MDNNYTPIDVKKMEGKDNGLNTVLLVIVTLTALVLAILLFVLIQKKINSAATQEAITPTPTKVVPTVEPTLELVTPTTASVSPTVIEPETTITPEATEAGGLEK